MAEQKPVDLAAVSFRVSGLAGACGLGRCEHSCGVRRLLVDSGDLLHGGRHGFMVGWTLWLC